MGVNGSAARVPPLTEGKKAAHGGDSDVAGAAPKPATRREVAEGAPGAPAHLSNADVAFPEAEVSEVAPLEAEPSGDGTEGAPKGAPRELTMPDVGADESREGAPRAAAPDHPLVDGRDAVPSGLLSPWDGSPDGSSSGELQGARTQSTRLPDIEENDGPAEKEASAQERRMTFKSSRELAAEARALSE